MTNLKPLKASTQKSERSTKTTATRKVSNKTCLTLSSQRCPLSNFIVSKESHKHTPGVQDDDPNAPEDEVNLEAGFGPEDAEAEIYHVLVGDELRVKSLYRSKTSTREIPRSDAPLLLQSVTLQQDAHRQRQRLATAL